MDLDRESSKQVVQNGHGAGWTGLGNTTRVLAKPSLYLGEPTTLRPVATKCPILRTGQETERGTRCL